MCHVEEVGTHVGERAHGSQNASDMLVLLPWPAVARCDRAPFLTPLPNQHALLQSNQQAVLELPSPGGGIRQTSCQFTVPLASALASAMHRNTSIMEDPCHKPAK